MTKYGRSNNDVNSVSDNSNNTRTIYHNVYIKSKLNIVTMDATKHYVKDEYDEKQPLKEIIEVWESFSGWYWFITEKESEEMEAIMGYNNDGTEIILKGTMAFGLTIGFEAEWGEIFLGELEQLATKGKVWKVPKSNWFSISHVITKREGDEQK